jgi:hypothetical protein
MLEVDSDVVNTGIPHEVAAMRVPVVDGVTVTSRGSPEDRRWVEGDPCGGDPAVPMWLLLMMAMGSDPRPPDVPVRFLYPVNLPSR